MVLLLAVVGVWTNVAGRAITAEPVRIEGASVVLKTGAESERTLPLAVFLSAEQARLRAALGEYPLSPRLNRSVKPTRPTSRAPNSALPAA